MFPEPARYNFSLRLFEECGSSDGDLEDMKCDTSYQAGTQYARLEQIQSVCKILITEGSSSCFAIFDKGYN